MFVCLFLKGPFLYFYHQKSNTKRTELKVAKIKQKICKETVLFQLLLERKASQQCLSLPVIPPYQHLWKQFIGREENAQIQENTKEHSPKKMQEFLSSECISSNVCTRRQGPNLRREFAKTMFSPRYYPTEEGIGLNPAMILDMEELNIHVSRPQGWSSLRDMFCSSQGTDNAPCDKFVQSKQFSYWMNETNKY